MKILTVLISGIVGLCALQAYGCTIELFGSENLLSSSQNTPLVSYQELEAFASGNFSTVPIFTGTETQLTSGLDIPIDLSGFGYAVAHYAPGSSGNPQINRGGTFAFYHIVAAGPCDFTFPQYGPGKPFSNGRITSVILFTSRPIADQSTTGGLLTIGFIAIACIRWAQSGTARALAVFRRARAPFAQ
jgi:hypothetical protein